jgi:ABC-type nitrate/sulfonate/bicarbonate transport system substrate-binding protein
VIRIGVICIGPGDMQGHIDFSSPAIPAAPIAKMGRRRFLGSAVAAALTSPLLSSCHSTTGQRSLTHALGWVPNVEYANYWIALDRHLFAQEGVQLKYLPGGPNVPQPVIEIAAGQANIGDSDWLPLVDALAHGNDFVILASLFPVAPTGLISLPRRPVLKPADLVGARLLVQGPAERRVLDATFRLNHLPLDYQFVPVGFSPEALLAGSGDAYYCFITNQPLTLEGMGLKQGTDFFVTRMYDLGYRVPSALVITPRATLATHREMLTGYLRALLRARAINLQNPEYAATLAVTRYGGDLGLDLKQQTRLNAMQVPLELAPSKSSRSPKGRPFWIDEEDLTGPMYQVAAATGRTALPDPKRLLDNSLLSEAYRAVGI